MSNAIKKLKITLGTDNFEEMVTQSDVFVDKTLFIKEIIESEKEAILITHPRRWGKTLNLDMLKAFLMPEESVCKNGSYQQKIDKSLKHTPCHRDLFTGGRFLVSEEKGERNLKRLLIADVDGGKYMRYQGKYPVVFLSLKDVVGNSAERIEAQLRLAMSKLYAQYKYLLDHLYAATTNSQESFSNKEEAESSVKKFKNILKDDAKIATIEEVTNGIYFLTRLLYEHHDQGVYVLIDEYDRPVNSLLENYLGQEPTPEKENLIKNIVELISQTVCSSISKTNPYLEKLILIGIFDTTHKESASGCNNINVYGISDINFSKNFGFSEEEVKALVAQLEFTEQDKVLSNIKEWYNGYLVPISVDQNIRTYTPWAVMNYLNTAYKDRDFKPQSYWIQSGASTILQNIFKQEACLDTELIRKLKNMISQNGIALEFNQHISLFKYGVNNVLCKEKIFSYSLVNLGYLTVQKEEGQKYIFSIPNFEVRQEFVEVIEDQIENFKRSNYTACHQLLDDLHKKQHVEILKSIASNNNTAIEEIFQKSNKIVCSDDDLNFNYFHIAFLSNNTVILNNLLTKCSENITALLAEKDKIFGLNSKDYMQLSKEKQSHSSLEVWNSTGESLKAPIIYESVFCNPFAWYSLYSLVICPAVTAIVKFCSKKYTQKEISIKKLFLSFFITGVGVTVIKNTLKYFDHCKEYSDYYAIDISSPSTFDTLKQFKKYSIDNDNVYTIVGEECEGAYQKLQTINIPIFSQPFYGKEELTFTLCATAMPVAYKDDFLQRMYGVGSIVADTMYEAMGNLGSMREKGMHALEEMYSIGGFLANIAFVMCERTMHTLYEAFPEFTNEVDEVGAIGQEAGEGFELD